MMKGISDITADELNSEIARALLPRLLEHLAARGPGHCMRVQDLDLPLALQLCAALRAGAPAAQVVILAPRGESAPADPFVSPTKLVELRNPDAEGRLRSPLMVFIPTAARAAAEDSFGVATFEDIEVVEGFTALEDALIAALPPIHGAIVRETLRELRAHGHAAAFSDTYSALRWLLTAQKNGNDTEVLGAAVFHIGLIPDFAWLADPAKSAARARANHSKVEQLTWSALSVHGRIQRLELKDAGFRKRLGAFLLDSGTEDPRQWARHITMEPLHWGLSFDKWEFVTEQTPERVCIFEVEANLRRADPDAHDGIPDDLDGHQVLPVGAKGLGSFSVSFQVDPHPLKVQGLDRFVVQVISLDNGPVGLNRTKKAWSGKTQKATVAFTGLSKVAWQAGWHFVRVMATTADGESVPLVDGDGHPIIGRQGSGDQRMPNESDLFYVLPGGEVEVEPVQRAIQRAPGLLHALFDLQFKALSAGRDPAEVRPGQVRWTDKGGQGTDLLAVTFGRDGTLHVPVSQRLREIESRILAAPGGALGWHLVLGQDGAGPATEEATEWPRSPLTDDFLAARGTWLGRIAGEGADLVSEAADYRTLLEESLAYADSFLRLLESLRRQAETDGTGIADLRDLLRLDTVRVTLADHRGEQRQALILAPTHPLRALWYALWAQLGIHWIDAARELAPGALAAVRAALLRFLNASGFPPVLPVGTGRLFTQVDNLTPFWTLYAPSTEADPRGLLGQVCTALGLPEPGIGGAVIDGDYLAARFERYLAQHPYVRTLTLNTFNAGRAGVIAEALLALQGNPALTDLRYEVRLFAQDPEAPGLADGLAELLNPSAGTTAGEADAFCTPAEHHLFPKLAVAVLGTADYLAHPDRYRAHLTLLFDCFAASEVGATRGDGRDGIAPVHGLVADMAVEYEEDESVVAWRRHPRFGLPLPIGTLEDEPRVLTRLGRALANATAEIATGRTGMDLRPQVTLSLSAGDKTLLHLVHEHSDWVLTLDRNMGIEYFDHGGRSGARGRAARPDYLIDHSPDIQQHAGPKLVISSRSLQELQAMLGPVLAAFGLPTGRDHALTLLDQLRSLSGRLALKLVSAPNQQAEAMGLALARLFLEDQGVFLDQVVVPLDAHQELYRGPRGAAEEVAEVLSFKRTDLALFDLNPRRREIVCRLVEVKCYHDGGDLFGSASLREKIVAQIEESRKVLAGHFDLYAGGGRRPDHMVKARELAVLLDFYLARAERYRLVAPAAAEEARFFLRTIDEGYRLSFTRTGLVFDFAKDGLDQPDEEFGVEFHRIGADRIRALVDAAAALVAAERAPVAAEWAAEPDAAMARVGAAEVPRAPHAEATPTLAVERTAAFLSPPRDRTIDWDSVATLAATVEDPRQGSDLRSRSDGGVAGPEPSVTSTSDTAVTDPLEHSSRPAAGHPRATNAAPEPGHTEDGTAAPEQATEPNSAAGQSAATPGLDTQCDIVLGTRGESPQFGILGESQGRTVGLDLNETHTISLFGVQGGGKSYTLGGIVEMALRPIPGISRLPKPLGGVIFHYSPTMDYAPEFTSMVRPNSSAAEVELLRQRYGASPERLEDVVIVVPEAQIEERRREFPDLEVVPLKFASSELQVKHWSFLMGAVGNQAVYLRQLKQIFRDLRRDLRLDALRRAVDQSRMADNLKELAQTRLDFAAEYIADGAPLKYLFRPGRLVIIDLRDELLEKDEALGLFVVLLHLVSEATSEGAAFNKLVVFDEAHKYIQNPDLVDGLVEVIREMRHKGTSILIASQDPQSVQVKVIELSTQIVLHRFNSPAWLKHIQKANAALAALTPGRLAQLQPGEAFVWSSKASDEGFSRDAVKVRCRPRVTAHGGGTRTAV